MQPRWAKIPKKSNLGLLRLEKEICPNSFFLLFFFLKRKELEEYQRLVCGRYTVRCTVWNCVLYCHGAATLLSIVGHCAVLTVYRVRLKTPVNAGCSSEHSCCNCWYSFEAAQFRPCTYVYILSVARSAEWHHFAVTETRVVWNDSLVTRDFPNQWNPIIWRLFPGLIWECLVKCRERGRLSEGVVVLGEEVATNAQRQAEIFFSVFRNIPLISVRRDSHIVQLLFFSRVPLAGLFPTPPVCCFSFQSVSELICPRSWKTSAGGRTISCRALFHQDNLSAWISESDSNETFKDKPFPRCSWNHLCNPFSILAIVTPATTHRALTSAAFVAIARLVSCVRLKAEFSAGAPPGIHP